MTKQNITFLGLGTMGYPMAGFLSKNEHYEVTVFNRTVSKAEKWTTDYKGSYAITIQEAVSNADFIVSCAGNDNDVREIYEKVFSSAKKGALLIDHTTTSANLARELYDKAKASNMEFLDAPVSGGEAGAQGGVLTIMVGGDQSTFDKCEDLMNTYAKATTLVGESGKGQVLKMVNQLCIAGLLEGLSEAWSLAKASNIDPEMMLNVLQHGAAGSWQMVNRTKTAMNDEFDLGFAIDWMRKDLYAL